VTGLREFRLPDVGEGLTEAEIVNWLVAEGDEVSVNDALVEVETAKSIVELPSPYTGRVARLLVAPGDVVPVGSSIIAIAEAGAVDAGELAEEKPEPVLVGYGVSHSAAPRRRLTTGARPAVEAAVVETPGRALAAPPVRALARRLGVDLASLAGPQPVSRERVQAAASPAPAAPVAGETRVPIRGIRKATAAAMVASAFTAPHAAVWVTVDVTESIELLAKLRTSKAWAGVRLSPLTLVARALLVALREHPELNAAWDEAAQELVLKSYVNLGFAAATPRGLTVPNIKGAESLGFRELCERLSELVDLARENRTPPTDLAGGTITITNLGPLGVDGGVPILNPGESAILAVGVIRPTPWVVDGRVEVRQIGQLVLSFDHRVADGAEAAALLRTVGELLSDPAMAAMR
jgi:2-oxoisovalerate dehydrogenase E2 component (dihydrolipoyl transacylase)